MSQSSVILPGSPLAGSAMVGDINAAWAAIISKFSGTVAPTLGPGVAGAVVEGQWWLDTSITPNVLRVFDGASWAALLTIDPTNHVSYPPLSFRNIVGDNGGMEVWQRGAGSSASIAVGASTTAYTADRWYVTTGANQASVIAAVAGLTNGSNLAAKVTRNNAQTGTTAYIFGFPLDTDELARMRGQKVTISAAVKSGANWSPASGTINLDFYTGTGAVGKRGGGFSSETHVATATLNLGTSTQGTISGVGSVVVPTGATQGELQFTWSPSGTAGADDSITIDDVQLEVGVFASQPERPPFETMIRRCKRHYRKTFPYGTAPAQSAGLSGALTTISPSTTSGVATRYEDSIPMRVTPSVTTFNPSTTNANWRNVTSTVDSVVMVDSSGASPERVLITSATSTASAQYMAIHASADAGI